MAIENRMIKLLWVCGCVRVHVEVRGQLLGVGSLRQCVGPGARTEVTGWQHTSLHQPFYSKQEFSVALGGGGMNLFIFL